MYHPHNMQNMLQPQGNFDAAGVSSALAQLIQQHNQQTFQQPSAFRPVTTHFPPPEQYLRLPSSLLSPHTALVQPHTGHVQQKQTKIISPNQGSTTTSDPYCVEKYMSSPASEHTDLSQNSPASSSLSSPRDNHS
jgi:hypothetical protein